MSSPTSRRTGSGSGTTGSSRTECSGRAPSRDHPGTKFLHEGHPSLPSGKGKFHPVEYQPPIEEPDSEYPFVLSTGRTLYHYNSGTMTMRESGIKDKQVDPFFEIAPEDASALGVADGEWVRLVSRRGEPPGPSAVLRPRVSRARLDGAPLLRSKGEPAHPRRGRPADRDARVQGFRRPAGASLRPLEAAYFEPLDSRPLRAAVSLPRLVRDDAAHARLVPAGGRSRGHRRADGRTRPHGSPLGGARGQFDPRLGAPAPARGASRGGADTGRRSCHGGRRRARDRARRADQVAERRHARPAQGRGRARGAEGRRGRARDRAERQSGA